MDNYGNPIGSNIAALRLSAKYTQADLAEKLGYTDKAVSKWERSESVPDVFVLKKIADLFGVTVDYLLEEHNESEIASASIKNKHNRRIITLLSVALVWLIATIAYVVIALSFPNVDNGWLTFVAAVPASCIVWLVLNSVWEKARHIFFIISILIWSGLVFVYLLLLQYNYWLIFVLGIPAQTIVLLWSRLKIWTADKIASAKKK